MGEAAEILEQEIVEVETAELEDVAFLATGVYDLCWKLGTD